MDFVSRLMSQTTASLQDPVEPQVIARVVMDDGTDDVWISTPVWATKWKRLVITLGLVQTHALTGSIISYLETMRERRAQEALDQYQRLAGQTRLSTQTQEARKKTSRPSDAPKPMAKGKALSRSTVKKFPIDPEDCLHPEKDMSGPRGGHGGAKWVTCLRCGSRWERCWDSPQETVQSASGPAQTGIRITAQPTQPLLPIAVPPGPTETASAAAMDGEFVHVETETPTPQMSQLMVVYESFRHQGCTSTVAMQQMLLQAQNEEEATLVCNFWQTVRAHDV